ncbi:SDR family oxidoreductase [Rhodococcus sp. 1R11]|uniref:SDR family oxidoreductase n=1 Tax=Rhodococcus sp. 1R11 TaxID=2559614 RepID=UPI0010721394|nr:SDR family oxidoreductase [Rhodococcus sp. 1R11]MBX5331877.1 SDR family oxidoreductase [Rhodococcus fascians]MBY4058095.1 SDR family oxidoreductase [Rhodococcus fascians]MBY4069738.1 SDR family oxidoreductase [Rhodococcus fascians]TFI44830.1 SDR family oxidoreductase [Rhodococcus sp. 1R11]
MKIVVIGGTGLIGSKLVAKLGEHGHDAVAASPNSGVDTLTGEGLADVLAGADVVVDVSNSPSFEDAAVLDFFTRATTNILAAESVAGVGHHVALSVVGTERLTDSGYMRAKVKQEALIKESKIPYSIVHATQFFEFFKSIARGATSGDQVRLSSASIQPIAADEVASTVGRVSVGAPLNGTVEIGGPEVFTLADFVARGLEAHGDPREVVVDDDAPYFGAHLADTELLPSADAQHAETTFEKWLAVDVLSGLKP